MKLLVTTHDMWLTFYAGKDACQGLRSLTRIYEESVNIADQMSISCAETHASDATKELTKLIKTVKPNEDTSL